jgi:hypothetical protein
MMREFLLGYLFEAESVERPNGFMGVKVML